MQGKGIIKSGSRSDLTEEAYNDNGFDLTKYKQQLVRERNARTLSLRQISRPSLKSVFGSKDRIPKQRLSLGSDRQAQIDAACALFSSGVESQIFGYCNNIINSELQSAQEVKEIAKSPEVAEEMCQSLLSGSFSDETVTAILGAITTIFPLAGENCTVFVDNLCFVIPEFLEKEALISPIVTFIGVISESSEYARDAVLCMELHKTLCDLAKASADESTTLNICEAIRKIVANPAEIDFQILSDAVPPIIELLDLPYLSCVHSIISALTEMACKMSTLVLTYYDYELYKKVITFIQTPELVDVSLKLIGILSIGQPSHVKAMLDDGMMPILMDLLTTEYAADVFWIFSNLIETLSSAVMSTFDQGFIASVVQLAAPSAFELKKEIAFFLATFALFADAEVVNEFLNDDVIDILVEMLGCGVSIVMLRIVDSLVRMLHQVQVGAAPPDFVSVIEQSDIRKRVSDIAEQSPGVVMDRAEYLISLLDQLEGGEQ